MNSLNHFVNGNITMNSVRIVELLVKLNYIKILSVAQQCFYAKFMSPATIQRTLVFM